MKNEELERLLKIAEMKFPVGTRFKPVSINGDEMEIMDESRYRPKHNHYGIWVSGYGFCYHHETGKWAEPITTPEPILEVIL